MRIIFTLFTWMMKFYKMRQVLNNNVLNGMWMGNNKIECIKIL